MQYMLMQENKMDDMDCSLEENQQNMGMVNGSFVPTTELDYLLLGCLLESQQITPTQSSPNTLRAFSMYQRQFENHKKKFAQTGFRNNTTNSNTNQFNTPFPPQNNNNSSFNQPMYNNNTNNGSTNIQKMYQQSLNNNSQNSSTKFQRPNLQQQIQNVSPNTTVDLISTSEKSSKKEKKKPKRPNKVKPQGCEWCKVTSSPVWRGGPSGKGSLCNACGLQYMKGFTLERAKETLRKSRGEWKVNSQL